MSLLTATLVPAALLLALGFPLLLNHSGFIATLKALPRSTTAAYLFFGTGAAWFLYAIWHLSPADFGEYRGWLLLGFGAVAVLSFRSVPDFLAVRGLCALVLLGAMPFLDAAYMQFDQPQRLFMVTLVYAALALARSPTVAVAGFPGLALRTPGPGPWFWRPDRGLRPAARRRGFHLLTIVAWPSPPRLFCS